MNKILLILGCLFLAACMSDSDVSRELEKKYPNCEVYEIEPRRYIMLDSTGIYYLYNAGINKPDFSKRLIKKY